MAQFVQNQSFLPQLGLDQFRHVFVMQPADHRHQGALHTGEASEENERAAHVVVPRCKMIDGQIHDERNASCSFNLGGHHSRCIEPLQAENADAEDVDETFKDAEGGHRCAECTMAFACAGCGNCGRCKDVELVDLNNIWVPELLSEE